MVASGNVSWFADIGLNDRPNVGGKGGSLGELLRAGVAVPPGFVVRTQAFEGFLEALEHEFPIRAQVELLSPDDLEAVTALGNVQRGRKLYAGANISHRLCHLSSSACGTCT